MSEKESIYPLEFYVEGTPISLRGSTKSKERWQNDLRQVARKRVQETAELYWLDARPLALSIYYFPIAAMVGDIDNIVKPILDALKMVAYLDDRHIERVVAQKFEPAIGWEFAEPSAQLTAVLDMVDRLTPLVYVRIDDDLMWRRL